MTAQGPSVRSGPQPGRAGYRITLVHRGARLSAWVLASALLPVAVGEVAVAGQPFDGSPLIPLTLPSEASGGTDGVLATNLDAGLLVAGRTRWDHDGDGVIHNETFGGWLWTPTAGGRIFRVSDDAYWTPSFYNPSAVADDGTVTGTLILRSSGATKPWRWSAAAGLEILPLPTGNWTGTTAAVSADGQVIAGRACRFNFVPVQCLESRALVWVNGALTELPAGQTYAQANGLDASGTVVVGAAGASLSALQATRWIDGAQDLLEPVGTSSTARFTSADGTIAVGTAVIDDDAGDTVALVRWGPGGEAEILGPPEGMSVVELHAISADGSFAVGSVADGPGDPQFRDWDPFVWSAKQGFAILPEANRGETFRHFNRSRAVDVSDDGSTVVGVLHKSPRGPGDPPAQAVVWTGGTGFVSINELMLDLGIEEPDFFDVAALSADGEWVLAIGAGVPGTSAALLQLDPLRPDRRALLAPWIEETKLTPSDGKQFGQFGFSVALDGDTALVGALHSPFVGVPDPGAVYALVDDGAGWVEQARLTASDAAPRDGFGSSVALAGDVAVIGAPNAIVAGANGRGAAYVLKRSDGMWSEEVKLTATDGVAMDAFGRAVALSGDTLLVAAPGADVGGHSNQGAVYVFTRSDGVWSEQAKLVAADGAAGDAFGLDAVALAGDTALIGARQATVDGDSQRGAAYVFTRSGDTWSQQAKLTAADGEAVDFFGDSVALEGSTAVVGARLADGEGPDQGAAYVFTRNGEFWSQQAKLTAAGSGGLGSFVALRGDLALVGAPATRIGIDNNRGAAYLFTRSGGVWEERAQRLLASDGMPGDFFGRVALADDALLVTAVNADIDGKTDQGAAYVFRPLPPEFATIEGMVRGLGHCGAHVAPLENATVEISGTQDTVTLETDRDGFYQTFLPDSESPLDIEVSAPGHLPAAVLGVDFSGGDVVVQDVDLLLDAPCATIDPRGLAVVLTPNQNATETLTLGNVDGAAALEWTMATAQPPAADTGTTGAVTSGGHAARVASTGDGADDPDATDLASLLGEPLPSVQPRHFAGDGVDCESGPGVVLHDDGTIENGYSGNPGTIPELVFTDRFTPSGYPATVDAVCLAFATVGATTLDFEVVVFDDDGPEGGPGTELGALAATVTDIPVWPFETPVWASYDLSSLGISIDSGSVYLGARWAPPSSPQVFLTADESPGKPIGFAGGYWWRANTGSWAPIQSSFGQYRSLFVRAQVDPAGCLDPGSIPWLSVAPGSGVIPAGAVGEVSVSFDASGLAPGEYRASLCLSSNDPASPLEVVPVTLTVQGEGPSADIAPELLAFDVPLGDSAGDILNIGNVGDADLTWSISTDLPDATPGLRSHQPALDEPLDLPDFEIVPPINGGQPVAFTLPAGMVTRGEVVGFSFAGTASGIGGTETYASDTCLIVEAPDGTTFGVGGFAGQTLSACADHNWAFQGPGSTADGPYESAHDDSFDPAVQDLGEWTFTFVHDFDVTSAAPISWSDVTITLHKAALPVCDEITAVPWLNVDPTAGITPPAGTSPVDVTVDTTELAIGTFEGALCVSTNDPDVPQVPVPVTLRVGPPASFGTLEGTVASASSCVAEFSEPLPGVTVVVEGQLDTYTVETDSAGSYELALDAAESPVDITVTAPGHLPAEATGVTLAAGEVTVQDLDLTRDGPCIDVTPESLSATLEIGQGEDQALDVGNPGSQTLEWTIPLAPALRDAGRRGLLNEGVLLIPESTHDRVMAFDPETGDLIDADFIPGDPTVGSGEHVLLHPDGERLLLSDPSGDVVWAYDLEGTPLGVFAPAGGPDIGVLNNPSGMAIHPATGHLLVAGNASNFNAVAEFDLDGTFLGHFIDAGAGGISRPRFLEFRSSDLLVSASSGSIFRFALDGTPAGIWNDQIAFPQQLLALPEGNVLAATSESAVPGVWELDADGTRLASYTGVPLPRAVWELANGNILTTTGATAGGGVHEIDRGITRIDNKISGVDAGMISFIQRLDCALPDWLQVGPSSGSTEPGGADEVTVSFDAGGLAPGEHTAWLCVESNDPLQPVVQIPVTLTAVLPADFATVEGTVQSLGHCGSEAAPLVGATVEITSAQTSVTLVTGEDGSYQSFLAESESPIDITVTAPDHLPITVEDIGFGGGDTVIQDFDLVLEAPCATVEPPGVSVELPQGQTTTAAFTLGNFTGGAGLEWTIATAAPPVAGDGVAHAGPAGRTSVGDRDTASAMALATVLGEPLPAIHMIAATRGPTDCDAAPGLILHDDGTVENGYSGNPEVAAQVIFADRFTPSAYPASFTAVCVALLTLGPASLDFEVVVFDDDGADGSPGTELGALPASAENIPGVLGEPVWFSFDISTLAVSIDSGSVYIGVRWQPSDPNVFVAADEAPEGPVGLAGGYFWNDGDPVWLPIEAVAAFENYRSLFVRAVASVPDCDDPTSVPWLGVDPVAGSTPAGESAAVQVSLDATDLAPGDYRAALCITTNDASQPLIVAPIELTVVSGTPPVIDVDPDGLSSTLSPGETESQPLTIANLGDLTLDWQVTEEGGSWNEEQKLVVSDGAAFDFFGVWVAVASDTALVGASDADVGDNVDQGAAYVFVRSNGVWTEQVKLTASDGAALDLFGNSVALSADASVALVGAQRAQVGGNAFQGAAYVFTRSGDVWTEQAKLTASDGATEDQFGWQVSLSEDGGTALIGARLVDIEGDIDHNQGAAYVFVHSDGVWTEQAKLVASDGAEQDNFGETTALSADGDTALVGASFADPGGNNQQGAAWVFTRSAGVWTEQAKLVASDGMPLDSFGRSQLALSGDTALVGALTADVAGNGNQGAAYVFTRSGDVWSEQAKLTASDGGTGHLFGTAALRGDTALIGAGGDAGQAAYVFTRIGDVWTEQAKLTAADGPLARGFGSRVALAGDTALIGAAAAPVGGNAAQGAAYVFVRDGECTLPDWIAVEPLSGSVPGGDSQVVDITFDAGGLEPGEFSATLCLASNDPVTPLVPVPLTLTVTETPSPVLVFAPPTLDFGDIEVGTTSPPQTATLHNTGDADATALTFGGLPDGGFVADTSACGNTLPVGASCDIVVTFTPTAPGPAAAVLMASSAEGAVAELALSGNGVGDEGFTAMALEVDPEPQASDGNRVFEPGEQVQVAPAWRNDGPIADALAGTASAFQGPDGATYTLVEDAADYGTLEPGQTASCRDTGACYLLEIDDPAVRPATHWEASFVETLDDSNGTTKIWTLHIGDSFTDVPRESLFYPWIETLLHHQVTGGCADATYCPAAANTRGQMAVFLLKASEGGDYLPPACVEGEEVFADVPFDDLFCPWIEELAERGVTAGCGGGNYCPNASVNRDQMAVFLLKALQGPGYMPPACTGVFTDVPCPSLFANWIEDLVVRGITAGCGGGNYCPASPVSRDQMAVFLVKTFGLPLYGP